MSKTFVLSSFDNFPEQYIRKILASKKKKKLVCRKVIFSVVLIDYIIEYYGAKFR